MLRWLSVDNVTWQYVENEDRGDFWELPINESWELLQKLFKQSLLETVKIATAAPMNLATVSRR